MIMIEEILISEEVIGENFVCDLNACKGACCIEGDFGAPLEQDEVLKIASVLDKIKSYLPTKSWQKIKEIGFYTQNVDKDGIETELMEDGACVFMGRSTLGITYCAIEKAYNAGESDFKKPISCHLYPIRVSKNKLSGFQALNYDRWDICQAACSLGNKTKVKIFEFTKEALIRAYGNDFYHQLAAAAEKIKKS